MVGTLVLPSASRLSAAFWWLILIRGLCAVLFGILTLMWPRISLFSLVLLYGGYAFADGIFALVAATTSAPAAPRWSLVIVGLLGVAVGIITVVIPGMTALLLLYFIAFWAIMTGLMQVAGAIRMRQEIHNEWALIAGGIVSILLGVFLVTQPGAGALGLLFVISVYAIAHGILLILFALRMRKHKQGAP